MDPTFTMPRIRVADSSSVLHDIRHLNVLDPT